MPLTPLASAYPSTELSATGLAMMIIVPVGLLFAWLGLIFLATRAGSGRPQHQHHQQQQHALSATVRADD